MSAPGEIQSSESPVEFPVAHVKFGEHSHCCAKYEGLNTDGEGVAVPGRQRGSVSILEFIRARSWSQSVYITCNRGRKLARDFEKCAFSVGNKEPTSPLLLPFWPEACVYGPLD